MGAMTGGKKPRHCKLGGIIAPADLREYAKVLPDFPERHLAMMEKRQNYIMEARKAEARREHNLKVSAQVQLFVIAAFACGLAVPALVYG